MRIFPALPPLHPLGRRLGGGVSPKMVHRTMAVANRLGVSQSFGQVLLCFATGFCKTFTQREIGCNCRRECATCAVG